MSRHKMTPAYTVAFIYGALVLIGGIIGYVTAGSQMSLWSGLLFSLGLFSASVLMILKRPLGHFIAVSLTAVLTIFFHIRYLFTKLFMPAGMMALISAVVLVALVLLRPKNLLKR